MREIDKMRLRLKNADKNVVEYRMTIPEAKQIIADFEEMEKKLTEKPQPISAPVTFEPTIWDGGSL